jgi:hypothetical protein
MRKTLYSVLASMLLVTVFVTVASANSIGVVPGSSISVPQPNTAVDSSGITSVPQYESTGPVEVLDTLRLPGLPKPKPSQAEVSAALSAGPSIMSAGWYPCDNGTRMCYGGGSPSYACGPCEYASGWIWYDFYKGNTKGLHNVSVCGPPSEARICIAGCK